MSNISEVEKDAQELQSKLSTYATSNIGKLEEGLFNICNTFSGVDSQLLAYLIDPESQSRLTKAIDLTLETPFVLDDLTEILPYIGGFTMVAINEKGDIKAAHTNPEGSVYEYHGDNLYPYALSKAVQRLFLVRIGSREHGLENPRNYSYIRGFISPQHVFLGEAYSTPARTKTMPSEHLILGASGCKLSRLLISIC